LVFHANPKILFKIQNHGGILLIKEGGSYHGEKNIASIG